MKWILVYLFWTGTEIQTHQVGIYDDMVECFYVRESLAVDLGSINGYYPTNHQAICVKIE